MEDVEEKRGEEGEEGAGGLREGGGGCAGREREGKGDGDGVVQVAVVVGSGQRHVRPDALARLAASTVRPRCNSRVVVMGVAGEVAKEKECGSLGARTVSYGVKQVAMCAAELQALGGVAGVFVFQPTFL